MRRARKVDNPVGEALLLEINRLMQDLVEDGQEGRPRARRTFPYRNAGQPENRTQQARMKDTGHSGSD